MQLNRLACRSRGGTAAPAHLAHQDFLCLGFTDSLDVEQLLLGGVRHSLDRVESGILQLLDVTGADSALLSVSQGRGSCKLGGSGNGLRQGPSDQKSGMVPQVGKEAEAQNSPPPQPPPQLWSRTALPSWTKGLCRSEQWPKVMLCLKRES